MKRKSMIKAEKAAYEYIRRDEDGNVEGINRAVDGIDFDAKPGEFIAVIGHNGSGKSTFAKLLNRLLVPGEGALWVNGLDSADERNVWDIRQSAGMIFQNPDNQIVCPVVEEDVAFGPENLGVPTDEIWGRIEKSLSLVNMLDFRKSSPNKLSGGQKQRVAIAGVLAMRPKCIILDEATAMLDPQGRQEVMETVRELNEKENVTIILITHNMEEAVYADRIFVLDHGKVRLTGTPAEIFLQPDALEECRLDLPFITKLAYELKSAGIEIPDAVLSMEQLVEAICRLY